MTMLIRPVFALVAFCGLVATAQASDLPLTLPSMALDPPAPPTSPWSGLYVGTEMFAISGNGKGHVGGGGVIGYNHEFANHIVVGIDAASGFAPFAFPHGSAKGFDYAETDVSVGYDMGRWMPYVTTGVVLAKPNASPGAGYVSASQSANNLFNSFGDTKAAATLGAGFDYAVTDNLHVGLSVSGGTFTEGTIRH